MRQVPQLAQIDGPVSRDIKIAAGLAERRRLAYLKAMVGETKIPAEKPEAVKPAPPKPGGKPIEHGGPKGPEPTRYGDWEKNGRCIDF